MAQTQLAIDFPIDEAPQPELRGLLTPDDIYSRAEALIDQLNEDRRIERKSTGYHAKELGEYFSMWANTSPAGGIIVWGMADDGSIQGCESIAIERINNMENAGYDYAPGCVYDCKRIPAVRPDGVRDWVLVYRVRYHETRVITTSDRRVFVRRGDRCVELKTDEERQQLRMDKGEVQFEQEPCSLVFPDDFDKTLVTQLISSVRKIRRLNDETSDLKILCALRLGKMDGESFEPNNACAILLAIDPVSVIAGCKIHFLHFEGTAEKRGREYNEVANLPLIEGPIPHQINQINQILEQRIRRFSGFGKDGKFHTTPE
jgi:ATP-dependent DNA helicase RecG